ncbi:MAG TPA: hypothetical protein VM307_02105 [Egibacteraceae bacterium]|nr:hypothetical protein [Egibacteraceae bacterium]
MEDSGGFDGGDFLLGALLASSLVHGNQQRQIAQQQAAAEEAIVQRGEAAWHTAQQYGMTPQLHYEIAQAEAVARRWEQRRREADLAARAKHIRRGWPSTLAGAAGMAFLGFCAWVIAATLLELGDQAIDEFKGGAAALSAVVWLWWVGRRHEKAMSSLSGWERRWLHHHGGPWHAHEYTDLQHRH